MRKRPNTHARAENPSQARTGPKNELIRGRGRRRPHGTACTADSGQGRGQGCDAARYGLRGVAGGRYFGFRQVTAVSAVRSACRAATAQRWCRGRRRRVSATAVSCGNRPETRYTALWLVETAKPTKYPHTARQAVSGPYRAGKRANSRSRSPVLAAGQSNTQPRNRTFVHHTAGKPGFVTWITVPRAGGRATCARARARAYLAKKPAWSVNRCD